MKFSWFIALKYLRSKNSDSFIRVIRSFSTTGIALGVAALIVVMAVMNGFREELVKKIVGFNGHIYIYKNDGKFTDYHKIIKITKAIPEIISTIPVIEGEGLISFDDANSGVMIRSMPKKDLFTNTPLPASIVEGDFALKKERNLVIGKTLAKNMLLRTGDNLELIVPTGKVSIFGKVPNASTMEVSGIFDVGMSEYNKTFVFVNFDYARKIFALDPEEINYLEVELNNAEISDEVASSLHNLIGYNYTITDWKMKNFSIIHALKTERVAMFTILALIIVVAAFNIISGLTMMVKDKTSDIAIFRTIGATKIQIIGIFVIIGLLMGIFGTIAGLVLGVSFATNIDSIKNFLESFTGLNLFDPIIYYLSFMPAKTSFSDIIKIMSLSLILSLLSTIYPAYRAAKLEPAESLRFK